MDQPNALNSDKKTSPELNRQEKSLQTVNHIAQILLEGMNDETFEESIIEVMGIISHSINVDRGYIWQNEVINNELCYSLRFEWQNDSGRQTNLTAEKKVFPYSDVPSWLESFSKGEYVNGPLDEISEAEKERLINHGMKSVFAVPVYLQNNFWGYVSFDDCSEERTISENEMNNLRSICLIMVNAINHNDQMNKNRGEHFHQNNLLNTVNMIASILLQADADEFEKALLCCLGMMGDAVEVDRVYIWRNFSKNGKLYSTQLYEWSEGASPQQGNEYTNDISYDEKMPGWEETLSKGFCINGLISKMDELTKSQLAPQGILSILVVPVFLKEHFWGFVGFDDCHKERGFSHNEETILRSGSLLIAHAMLRNDLTLSLRTTALELEYAFEEAKAASRSKSNFLSNMSHEMRTPLNAIIGMTQIGKTSKSTEKRNYAFEKIEGASTHLLAVINDVLDMSKIEAGKFELSITEFEFEKMIQKSINITGFRIEEKKQNFTLYVDSDIPNILIGDEQRLIQVITNLLTNAVKFTSEGGSICLKAHIKNINNDLCTLQIEVTDTGIGISADQQKRLFSSFEQAESSISRKFGGTGLGLSICKRIVEMMNGRIWIESDLGKGSKFIFTIQLQCALAENSNIKKTENSFNQTTEENKIFSGGNYRLLLAEDVEINREIVISLLEPTNLKIECATNGAEAVKMFCESPDLYDMIFMDMQMPQMDGLEATSKIRKMGFKKASEIPIVAMTANVFKEDIDKCLEAGMNAHIGKPLDMNEVMDVLKRFLS
ncbi:MAG: ATP-binding protein [Treponema sp.]|nr:ATP-binding protein [Treponema sp.]MCL2251093.1 ATP-binding protein [Treponema sp.]